MRASAAVAIAAVAFVLAGCGGNSDNDGSLSRSAQAAPQFAGVPQRGTSLGSPKAQATLVEFTDLRCRQGCKDFEYDVMPELVRRYVRADKVRIELRVIGLSGQSSLEAAAWAGAAARQNRLYQFVDAFFRAYSTADDPAPTDVAEQVGLETRQARAHAGSSAVKAALVRTTDQARNAGIRAPAFFVSRGSGALQPFPADPGDFSSFSGALDRLLAAG